MQRRRPERDLTSARRTLERRMRLWRAVHGEDREVILRQNHPPGRQGMSDFFDARDLAATIAGQPRAHLIHHFTLVCSGWEHAEDCLGGDSFAALSAGLRDRPSGGAAASRRSTAPTASRSAAPPHLSPILNGMPARARACATRRCAPATRRNPRACRVHSSGAAARFDARRTGGGATRSRSPRRRPLDSVRRRRLGAGEAQPASPGDVEAAGGVARGRTARRPSAHPRRRSRRRSRREGGAGGRPSTPSYAADCARLRST